MKGYSIRVFLVIGLLALVMALSGCRDKGDKEPTVAPTPVQQQQNFQPAQKQEQQPQQNQQQQQQPQQQGAATPFQSPVSPLPTPQ